MLCHLDRHHPTVLRHAPEKDCSMTALNDEALQFECSEKVGVISTFEELGLKEELLRGIYAYNFEKPSAIQQRAILPIISGRNVVIQAQSGTGKTVTSALSALQSIDTSIRETQALVLSPTRELATQIQAMVLALGDYMNVRCHGCIGGTPIREDIRKLDEGQHIVSGTPGRVFDMIRRRNLRTRNIKLLVLDGADELLSKGFKDQIHDIYRYLPPSTQVVNKADTNLMYTPIAGCTYPTNAWDAVDATEGACNAAAQRVFRGRWAMPRETGKP
ncbi:hypothetical protein RSAG8_02508, partial [Rhizoctonia solani AG-8 WAC10335]